MITFSNIGNYGRLGNQLFQIALLKVVSLKTGYDIVLPKDTNRRNHHGQNCLLNNFKFKTIKYGDPVIKYSFSEKSDWKYDERVFKVPDNTDFLGFFQNRKYYTSFQDEIIEEFELIDKIEEKIDAVLEEYKNNTVSLHVRRGDLTDGTNPSQAVWGNDVSQNSIVVNYYRNALSLIPQDSTIFLFTGGSRYNDNQNDIKWCKQNFKDNRIIFVDFLNDIESFALMRRCKYNITSFISSFSWWASFLNKNKNVIAPLNFYPDFNIEVDDYYPKYWNLI
jgi:hypothetical protein